MHTTSSIWYIKLWNVESIWGDAKRAGWCDPLSGHSVHNPITLFRVICNLAGYTLTVLCIPFTQLFNLGLLVVTGHSCTKKHARRRANSPRENSLASTQGHTAQLSERKVPAQSNTRVLHLKGTRIYYYYFFILFVFYSFTPGADNATWGLKLEWQWFYFRDVFFS